MYNCYIWCCFQSNKKCSLYFCLTFAWWIRRCIRKSLIAVINSSCLSLYCHIPCKLTWSFNYYMRYKSYTDTRYRLHWYMSYRNLFYCNFSTYFYISFHRIIKCHWGIFIFMRIIIFYWNSKRKFYTSNYVYFVYFFW